MFYRNTQQITRLQQCHGAYRRQLSQLARQLAVFTGTNRSTLKAKFTELIATGLLEAQGKGRGAFYAQKHS